MNDTQRTTIAFLAGLAVGAGIALLVAPQSGEETREWIADTTKREFKTVRRSGQRSLRQLQRAVYRGQEKFGDMLRDGKEAIAKLS